MTTTEHFRVRSGMTGAEMARDMAANVISTFGAVKASDEDRQALADALIAYSVRWVNDRFHLGMPETMDAVYCVACELSHPPPVAVAICDECPWGRPPEAA